MTMILTKLYLFALLVGVAEAGTIERVEKVKTNTWNLAMNLNPEDGHIMGYTTGWTDDVFIGTYTEALSKDYLNRLVWNHPVSYIAMVRHQKGEVDAVKVFRFKESARSLLSRFRAMDPGREVVTEGGPLQESVGNNAQNMRDDPIFSVGGDLAFNWVYTDNGHRIVMTGGYLSPVNVDDDKTRGLGNDYACNPLTGVTHGSGTWAGEVLNASYPPDIYLQGTDYGDGWKLNNSKANPAYGNYAIYISEDATSFPGPGYKLGLEVNVESTLKFFKHGSEF